MTENDDRLPLIEASGIRIRITEQGTGSTNAPPQIEFLRGLD